MDDPLQALADYFAQQENRPFGNTEFLSGRTLQRFSLAGQEAATNLLTKAARALESGEGERARGLVDRAVRLPFDRHEDAHPAAISGHMELFSLISDEVEVAKESDTRWLDAAIAVLATADEAGRYELRDVLSAIDHFFNLTPGERRTLRSAIAHVPPRVDIRDLRLTEAELHDTVLSILAACLAYRAATAAPAG